jgi:hypothetical protein
MHATPLLLTVLVSLLLGLVGWGAVRGRSSRQPAGLIETRDDLLLGLLVLAAFALGVFLSFLLITIAM